MYREFSWKSVYERILKVGLHSHNHDQQLKGLFFIGTQWTIRLCLTYIISCLWALVPFELLCVYLMTYNKVQVDEDSVSRMTGRCVICEWCNLFKNNYIVGESILIELLIFKS